MPLSANSSVAIVGGGISGLSTAWHLAAKLPSSIPITIYEASPRTGGWIKSVRVPYGDSSILFEKGPHTLKFGRTNKSLATLELVSQLGLQDKIVKVPKNSKINTRYILHKGLLSPLPSLTLFSMLLSLRYPLYRQTLRAVRTMVKKKPPQRSTDMEDESIFDFVIRKQLGEDFANNFVSPLMHGVYGGDIRKLSMRSSMAGRFWEQEMFDTIVPMERSEEAREREGIEANIAEIEGGKELLSAARDWEVFSFTDGVETLTRSLRETLEEEDVKIFTNSPVKSIQAEGDQIRVQTATSTTLHTHVINTVPPHKLLSLLPHTSSSLPRFPNPVTITLVNLYFPTVSLPVQGYGYVIPLPTSKDENPERGLGVQFHSSVFPNQDDINTTGCKVTVLLGGHYYDDDSIYGIPVPNEEEAVRQALSLLERDLGITSPPAVVSASIQNESIPQYHVNHHQAVSALESYLDSEFSVDGQKRVWVGGNGVGPGVGLNDSILGGRRIGKKVLREILGKEAEQEENIFEQD